MNLCEWCNKELTTEQIKNKNRFCSYSCSAKWRNKKYGPNKPCEKEREKNAIRLKNLWKNSTFRANKINYMKTNNPVYKEGVVEKAHQTRLKNGGYGNYFKYGNGKISLYESKVYDFLINLNFYYNYAIPTKIALDAFPYKKYARNYKPDFTNIEKKICIEIDGYNHNLKKSIIIDNKKEECLKFLGFKIIRFTHEEIDNFNKFKENVLKCLHD
jgi:hypothetical protein